MPTPQFFQRSKSEGLWDTEVSLGKAKGLRLLFLFTIMVRGSAAAPFSLPQIYLLLHMQILLVGVGLSRPSRISPTTFRHPPLHPPPLAAPGVGKFVPDPLPRTPENSRISSFRALAFWQRGGGLERLGGGGGGISKSHKPRSGSLGTLALGVSDREISPPPRSLLILERAQGFLVLAPALLFLARGLPSSTVSPACSQTHLGA